MKRGDSEEIDLAVDEEIDVVPDNETAEIIEIPPVIENQKNENFSKKGRLRNFVLTIWMVDSFEVESLTGHKHFKYLVFQKEKCPKSGRIHIQAYVEFAEALSYKQVHELLPQPGLPGFQRSWVRQRIGSRKDAREYCMVSTWKGKDKGQIPNTTEEHGEFVADGERTDLTAFTTAILEGKKSWELCEQFPNQMLRHAKHYDKFKQLAVKPLIREPPQVIVICGETDLGKTRFVFDNHPPEDIFRIESEWLWFDGYDGHPVALLDEFHHQWKITKILQVLDRYPLRVPIKGGFVDWRPNTIYITSNTHPDEWYPNVNMRHKDALMRRIHKIRVLVKQQNAFDLLIKGDKARETASPQEICEEAVPGRRASVQQERVYVPGTGTLTSRPTRGERSAPQVPKKASDIFEALNEYENMLY
nr:putative replication associated protein [Crucivirus sp.]